jgi:hypothetical protein
MSTGKEMYQVVMLPCRIKFKMASQTQGIQQLLAAEKRAAEKVLLNINLHSSTKL